MPPSDTSGTDPTRGQDTDALEDAAAGQRPRLEPPRYAFTLHIDFSAIDPDLAGAVAATLALGLGTLCPHVATDTARLSPAGSPDRSRPVFCSAPGPGGAFCEDLCGHPGPHAESGVNGLRWDRAESVVDGPVVERVSWT